MGHRVRHLLRRDANIAPVRPRKVRQLKPLTRNLKTPADEENAGDWSEKDSDGMSSTDGEAKTKKRQRRLERSARGRARAISKAGDFERVLVSHGTETKYKKRVEQFLSYADKEKLALVADDEVDAAIVHELQLRTTCERRRGPTGGASVLPTSERKVGGTKNSLGRGEL